MSDNLPAEQDPNTPANYSTEQLQTIRNICAPDCTDNEFYVFMHLCKTYELDPFLSQIYAIKPKGKAAKIFCGKDGMLAIAHRSGQFNGMESGTRVEGEEIIGWARVYRKDAEYPFYCEVRYSEYNQGTPIWQTKKHTMIEKVAKVHALRDAFTIAGLYTEDEIDVNSLPRRDHSPAMPSPGAGPDTGVCIVEGCALAVDDETMDKIRPYLDKMGGPMCRNHAIEWFKEHPEAMK